MNTLKNQSTSTPLEVLLQWCSFTPLKEKRTLSFKDWEQLIDLAISHRIGKVLGQVIRVHQLDVPAELQTRLTELNKRSSIRMLSFTAEIGLICNELKAQAIDVIPLKGPIAAQQIYGDFTAKNSRDIDLLIAAENLPKVISFLEEKDYLLNGPFHSFSPKQRKAFLQLNNQLSFHHPVKKIQLEIHWRLFANPHFLPLSFQELTQQSSSLHVGKTSVTSLSYRHLLFYLSIHGAKHQWTLLYWLHELATLIQHQSFDWKALLQEAIDLGIERPVVQSIILAERLLQVKAPTVIQQYYAQHSLLPSLVEHCENMIREEQFGSTPKSVFNYGKALRYKMKLNKGFRYKLAFWSPLSVNDFELVRLPDSFFFAYYILRPFFWLWRYLFNP